MEFDPDLEGKDRNFVTALARGLEILRCFRRGDLTLTNSDFSERTGLPKATISRLTHTLCELDYLVADTRVGTYRLSAGVLRLGFSRLAAMDMRDRAKHEMHALRMGRARAPTGPRARRTRRLAHARALGTPSHSSGTFARRPQSCDPRPRATRRGCRQ